MGRTGEGWGRGGNAKELEQGCGNLDLDVEQMVYVYSLIRGWLIGLYSGNIGSLLGRAVTDVAGDLFGQVLHEKREVVHVKCSRCMSHVCPDRRTHQLWLLFLCWRPRKRRQCVRCVALVKYDSWRRRLRS